jgi:hypothetical protein
MNRRQALTYVCTAAAALVPAVLPADQDARDPSEWTPVKITGQQAAPEFADINAWINSKPLTMASLKGNVVVVHFMTFG